MALSVNAGFALAGDAIVVPVLVAILGVPLALLGLVLRTRMPGVRQQVSGRRATE